MTTLSTLSTAQREGLKTALLAPLAPFLGLVHDADSTATLRIVVESFMERDNIMASILAHTDGIDFAAALSADENARVAAAVKTAMLEALNDGETGSVAAALPAEQRTAIARAITNAIAPRVMKMQPGATTTMVEMMVEKTMGDDARMQAFLDAIDGMDLTAMSKDDERRVKAAAKTMILEDEDVDDSDDEEEEEEQEADTDTATATATMTATAPATLSDAQRTALIEVLSDLTLPYMPTLEGHMAESAREKALEIVNDAALLQRFLPLAATVDFAQMTADDKRRVSLVVKKIMYNMSEDTELYEGSPVAALSEAERVGLARVIRKAMPPALAYMVPGQPANGGEIMVDGIMSTADVMHQILEANQGLDFAALTEEDELRAVAATAKLMVNDDDEESEEASPEGDAETTTPAVEADKEVEQSAADKEKEKASSGLLSDDDESIAIAEVDIKGVDADGNLRGAVAATLSDDERTAIKRVITKAKPSSMFYSVPSKLVHLPFEEIVMASDDDLQKFLDATKGLTWTNLSEKDEARAIAVAKFAFFGNDEPEQETEVPVEETVEQTANDTPSDDVAAFHALSERERAVVEELVASSLKTFGVAPPGEDVVEAVRTMLKG